MVSRPGRAAITFGIALTVMAARPGLVTMHDLPLLHRYNPIEVKSLGPKKR